MHQRPLRLGHGGQAQPGGLGGQEVQKLVFKLLDKQGGLLVGLWLCVKQQQGGNEAAKKGVCRSWLDLFVPNAQALEVPLLVSLHAIGQNTGL